MRQHPVGGSELARPVSGLLDDGGVSPKQQSPAHLLVVDDQEIVRDFLTRCLEEWGYSVNVADNALAALEAMAARPAAVVFCDIKMPGHDGLWLLEQLREGWPHAQVIMTTGIDDVETVAQSRALGAFDYLTKPISPKQLRQSVRRAIPAPDESEPTTIESSPLSLKQLHAQFGKIEAEYLLECPVRCPSCGQTVTAVKAVRLLRSHVNFTSTLPRRGRLVVCPHCVTVMPAELSNF
jgi:CheY-like chemotaxis protein